MVLTGTVRVGVSLTPPKSLTTPASRKALKKRLSRTGAELLADALASDSAADAGAGAVAEEEEGGEGGEGGGGKGKG